MTNRIKRLRVFLSDFWLRTFWQHPNRLMGLKVAVSVAVLLIPTVLLGYSRLGGTLVLGVLGGAIAETADLFFF